MIHDLCSQDELKSIEEERTTCLRLGDEKIQQLNERLVGAEKHSRDLRAEMHRLQQQIAQTRSRVGKYKVSSSSCCRSLRLFLFTTELHRDGHTLPGHLSLSSSRGR